MNSLVVLVEGPSEKAMLDGILPRILPTGLHYFVQVFQGKQDLERSITRRIRDWQGDDTAFVILRDQDAADCLSVKQRLVSLAARANRRHVLIRIACHELESWYLGDLAAVERGLGISGIARHQQAARYRDPDQTVGPANELQRLTNSVYQKLSGSRAIAPHLSLVNNRSRSFLVFVEGIRRLVNTSRGQNPV